LTARGRKERIKQLAALPQFGLIRGL